jgi:hypothetical protein
MFTAIREFVFTHVNNALSLGRRGCNWPAPMPRNFFNVPEI